MMLFPYCSNKAGTLLSDPLPGWHFVKHQELYEKRVDADSIHLAQCPGVSLGQIMITVENDVSWAALTIMIQN